MSAVEKVELIYSSGIENDYKVPKKQWRKWNPEQRQMFNMLYSCMTDDPRMFQHPDSGIPYEEYTTTAWNAAWTAADFLGKHPIA